MDRISTIAAGIKPVAPIVYEATVLLLGWDESSWAPTPQLRWQRSPPSSSVFTCIGALGTPSRTGPLARKYLPGFPLQLIFAKVIR